MTVNPAQTPGSQQTSYYGGGASNIQRMFNENGMAGPHFVMGFPMQLASIAVGDIVSEITLGFACRIEKAFFVVTTPATTALKLATLNMEVGTTNVTGGTIALTSANCTPLGAKIESAAAPSANNVISASGTSSTFSIEASAVTAFVEGAGIMYVVFSDTLGG